MKHRDANLPSGRWGWGLIGWAGLGLLVASGCGVEDYEQRMQVQEQRLERFDGIRDDEMKYLGDPLVMPTKPQTNKSAKGANGKKEVDALPFDFFLLPPKGVDPKPTQDRGILYRYGGSSPIRVYVAGAWGASQGKTFRNQVAKELGANAAQENKKMLILGLGTKPLELEKAGSTDASSRFFIHFVGRDQDELAVVYEVPTGKADQEEVRRAIEASLLTLTVGGRAARLRSAYNRSDARALYWRLRMEAR